MKKSEIINILLVIDTFAGGGAQRQKLNLSKNLIKKGYTVDVFVYDDNYPFFEKHFLSSGVKIHKFQRETRGFSFGVIRYLRQLIKNKRYSAIISSLHTPGIYTAIALIGLPKTNFIICEGSSSLAPISFFKRIAFYLSTLMANHIVCNSFNEKKLIKKLPFRSKKVHTIWNGFDVSTKSRLVKAKDLKIKKRLIVIGRVVHAKNGLNLLRALDLFKSRNNWIPEFIWIGRRDESKRSSKDRMSVSMQKKNG